MKKFAQLLFVLSIMMVALNLNTRQSSAGCEDPETLVFSIIPTEESIQELTIYKPVIDYLGRMTGTKIKFYVPIYYENVIQGMAKKWIDVAILGPYSYVIANKKEPDIQVFATYIKKAGYIQEEGPGYKSILITKKGSGYVSIKSLKGAIVGLTNLSSTSGYLIPRVLFAKYINMPFEKYFGKIVYTGGHDLSAMAIYDGRIDAAFVATHRFDNAINRGIIKKDDYNYLWSSPIIPQDPFCYRNALCPELKKKIIDTFLTLHTQSSCSQFLIDINAKGFVEMNSEDYDVIRELEQKIE
ncbi:MAG: phosphate/phosphite/phosphonate ABC transporter substrate-binding protein [Desulfobacula sp.]|jgi:phosphonate transport system substrate-binding protein|nr:phosphate/phosphite/phosphonate ABC transporter substrate-binding protein [Desulfobacula sp.]